MSLGLKVLPGVLSQFATLYPNTHVAVNLSDSFVDIVEEDFDLAIRISGVPMDKSTIWRIVCPVPRVLCASAAYIGEKGMPQDPEDLAGYCCLGYGSGARSEVWGLNKGPIRRVHKAEGLFSANNGDLLARLIVNGEGIALLPRFIVEDELKTGSLVQILPEWSAPNISLTLYYPPYERLPLRVATFSDFFETYVKETRPIDI